MEACASSPSFSFALSARLARVRISSYLRAMGASLLELKLSALALAAVFVQSAVNLRGPSQALARALDAEHVTIAYRITTLTILLIGAAAWTMTQWTWIMQPRQVGFARSLPISRGTDLSAICATLAFTDLLLFGLIADATGLAAAGAGNIAVATLHVLAGLTLGVSLFALQWCVLMRAFATVSALTALGVFASLPALPSAAQVVCCVAAISLQVLFIAAATRSAANRHGRARMSWVANPLALRWPLAALPMRTLIEDLRRGVGLRLGLLLLVQALAIVIVNAKAVDAPDGDIALVGLHLMGFLLATKLCDNLLQARARIEPFLRALPRSRRYWAWVDGIAVGVIALVCGMPVWIFALATGHIGAFSAVRIVGLSLIPLALFVFMRITAIRGRGGYLVLLWLLSTWVILT